MVELTEQKITDLLQSKVDESVTSWEQVPHYSQFLNMELAVNRFMEAVNNNQKILFVHDSDCDGIGTYMLSHIFFQFFPYKNIEVIITNRAQGYGFVPRHLDDRIDDLPSLIITADNGITAIDACNRADELGISVIITDHHQVDTARGLPKAIVVDPHQPGCPFPFKHINGTVVYWYFLSAIQDIAKTPINMIQEFLPELTLTTISDVMPLQNMNRFIVKEGLKVFPTHHRQWVKTFFKGHDKTYVTAEDLAFGLIPAINATGRLTTADDSAIWMTRENDLESTTWLDYIKNVNAVRKARQFDMNKTIAGLYQGWLDQEFILIPGQNFEKGILGPTAGTIAQNYKKPTFVVSLNKAGDTYSGSGRSTGSIDLLGIVKDNPYTIQHKTGGHKAACAVSFPADKLMEFFNYSNDLVKSLPKEQYIDKSLDILGNLPFRLVSYSLFQQIETFQPFGKEYPKPVFECEGTFKKLSKIGKERNHYSMVISDGLGTEVRAMWFFFRQEASKKKRYNIKFTINKDSYNKDDPEAIVLFIENIEELGDK